MKSFFLLLLACLLLTLSATAQTAIAKLKYEDAEEAFTQEEYLTTLNRLDEAEKILGTSNPRILYLRILATEKLVEAKHPAISLAQVQALDKSVALYLSKYENLPGNEDKYREIYKIDKILQSRAFVNAFADKYKFKKGVTLQEFAAYNPEAFRLANTKQEKTKVGTTYTAESTLNSCEVGPAYFNIGLNGTIDSYTYIYSSKTSENERTELINSIMQETKKHVDAKYLDKDLKNFLIVNVPGANAKIKYDSTWELTIHNSTRVVPDINCYKIYLIFE